MERIPAPAHVSNGELRLPPHNREVERALLGTMLRDPSIIGEVAELTRAAHFHVFGHQQIFAAIVALGEKADVYTVAERLTATEMLDDAGGSPYLAGLLIEAPSAALYREYSATIRQYAARQQLIHLADDLRERAYDLGESPGDAVQFAAGRLADIEYAGGHRYRFAPMDSAAFAVADFRPTWIIKRLLVKDQPCILGGPKKALKTSLLIDLALSIGTGTPFLGQFAVQEKRRAALISGESGRHTIQETARRVALAKGIDLETANVLWDFRLPQLASAADLAELGRGLRAFHAEAVIVDPLYLTLLSGQGDQGLQASNLYDMGPLLLRVAQTCLEAGATPILAHHAKRGRTTGAYEPLDLDDLAFSGIAEFARQWLLVSRREAYEPGSGLHRLWFSAGGSIGHGGLWALDVAEGQTGDDFNGRRWEVTVMTAGDSKAAQREAREDQHAAKQLEKDAADDAALLLALDRLDPQRHGAGFTKVSEVANLKGGRMTRAAHRLTEAGIVEELPVEAIVGNGAKRAVKGIRRRTSEHPNETSAQLFGCSGTSS